MDWCNFHKLKGKVFKFFSFKQITKAKIKFCSNFYTNSSLTIQDNGRKFTILKYNSILISFGVLFLNKPLTS